MTEVMRRDFLVADASDMIDIAFQRLQNHDCRAIPVVRRGRLVGLLTIALMLVGHRVLLPYLFR